MTPGTHTHTQKGVPVTLHNAALDAFIFKSVHPKGELVIVNCIRKANPMRQAVHTTLRASSWLASCSEKVLQSQGRKAMYTRTHAEHWDGSEMKDSKILRVYCKDNMGSHLRQRSTHFLHALANTTEHCTRAGSQRTEHHQLLENSQTDEHPATSANTTANHKNTKTNPFIIYQKGANSTMHFVRQE